MRKKVSSFYKATSQSVFEKFEKISENDLTQHASKYHWLFLEPKWQHGFQGVKHCLYLTSLGVLRSFILFPKVYENDPKSL